MKRDTVGILLVISCIALMLSGCQNAASATQKVQESEETEKEGTGEDTQIETELKEAAENDSEQSQEESVSDNTEETRSRGVVAVSLKDEKDLECQEDGNRLKNGFTEKGCETYLCYADNDPVKQKEQVSDLISQGAQVLIIDPVDPYGWAELLKEAGEKEISVFSYQDLIMQSGDVDYYLTFDMRKTGQKIARRVIERKDLKKLQAAGGQATIEFIMGSGEDLGSLFLFNGILEELAPYLEDGTLCCLSGQMTFEETAVQDFSGELAAQRFKKLCEDFYKEGGYPDIICTGFDEAVSGILEILDEAQIYPDNEDFPLINGVGCQAEVIRAIAEGRVSFDVYLDRKELSTLCVSMADTVISGGTPEVNNYEQYDNGTKLIYTNTCDGELMASDNYEMLIDMGRFTEEEVAPVYAVPVKEESDSLFPFLGERRSSAEKESIEVSERPKSAGKEDGFALVQ